MPPPGRPASQPLAAAATSQLQLGAEGQQPHAVQTAVIQEGRYGRATGPGARYGGLLVARHVAMQAWGCRGREIVERLMRHHA